jgi:intracellular sulfur oxidation DsrE/DsrF family protein
MKSQALLVAAYMMLHVTDGLAQAWPEPRAPAIPPADGYVLIPNAAVAPDPALTYRSIFDGTRTAAKPDALLPAVNAAGGVLNDLAVGQVPNSSIQMAIVFHGPAVDGLLDNAHYRAKFGVDNPNLRVLAAMKSRGVQLFVCGQHLAAERVDPTILSADVTIASDAYLVLITFQNRGHALMLF